MALRTFMPGELLRGYLCRLRNENGLRDDVALATMLGVPRVGASNRSSSANLLLPALLAKLGAEVKSLICQHSMVPFAKYLAVSNLRSPEPPDFSDASYLWFAMSMGGIAPRLCRDCATEDLNALGISYWRRLHQLPGIDWCAKHGRPLSEVLRGAPFGESPLASAVHAIDISAKAVEAGVRSPVVRRYATIAETILETADRPVNFVCAATVIEKRALDVDLSVTKHPSLLSDEAMRQTPNAWLRMHFPASATKVPNKVGWIDYAGTLHASPVGMSTFSLAMALLWDDPHEAIKALSHAHREKLNFNSSFAWSESDLSDIWVKNRGCHKLIAAELDLNKDQASRRLTKAGLPLYGRHGFEELEKKAITSLRSGKTSSQVARACKVSEDLIERVLRSSRQTENVEMSDSS